MSKSIFQTLLNFLKRYPNLTVAILSPILFFGILEGIFHFIPSQPDPVGPLHLLNPFWEGHKLFISDEYLFWRLKPNNTLTNLENNASIPINNLGFRGENFDAEKLKDYYRILCIGDSCTFCWEVPYRNGYPEKLQSMLQQQYPDKKVKVINAGVPGYTTFQAVRVYKKYNELFKPSIVILWAFNDYNDAYLYQDKDYAQQLERFYLLRKLISMSRFCSFLDEKYQKFRTQHISPEQKASMAKYYHIPRVTLQDFEANIKELYQLTRSRNQHLVLMTRQTNQKRNQLLEEYNETARRIGKENNIPVVEIAKPFSGPEHKNLYIHYPQDPVHFKSTGYELVANEVATTLVQVGYLR